MVRLALASRIASRSAAEPGSGASPGTSVSVTVSTPVPGKSLNSRSSSACVKTSSRSRAAERSDPRQAAKLPLERAIARDDVARRAAGDHADMNAGEGRIESSGRIALGAKGVADSVEFGDEQAGGVHRADALVQIGGVNLEAAHPRDMGGDALMRVRDLHRGGLADDHRRGPRQIDAESGDRVERTEASRLLVVAEQNMDRPLQRGGLELGDHREANGVEALHVDRAAP